MLYRVLILGVAVVMALAGCKAQDDVAELPLPEVPSNLTTPQERAEYVLTHFWDALDMRDHTLAHNKPLLEQTFVNFLSVFPVADGPLRDEAARLLVNRVATDSTTAAFFSSLSEKYLYEMESPLRNDDYYASFLRAYRETPPNGGADKARAEVILELIAKNRPGLPAPDFTFKARDGKNHTLYSAPTNGHILLFFYDPTCDHCTETIEILTESNEVNKAQNGGRLTIMAIDPGGYLPDWQETAPSLPQEWIVGYNDGSVDTDDLFDFRYMPTIYLLSPERLIIKKEIFPGREQLAEALGNL